MREMQRVLLAKQSRVSNHLGILRRARLVETGHSNGPERYEVTEEGKTLWRAVAGAVADPSFSADDRRLADVLEERKAAIPAAGFDALAPEWDRVHAPFYASGVREAALMRLVPRGLRVADVGCGTGLLTLTLARVAARVIAVDASPRMARLARRKAAAAGARNVTVRQGFAEKLPLPSGSLDALFAFHVLRHIARPADAIADFARTLKPGGRVVLVELEPHAVRALREMTGSVHLGLPRDVLRGLLKKAGFEDARFAGLAEPYRVPLPEGETSLAAYIVDGVLSDDGFPGRSTEERRRPRRLSSEREKDPAGGEKLPGFGSRLSGRLGKQNEPR